MATGSLPAAQGMAGSAPPSVALADGPDGLTLRIAGEWVIEHSPPSLEPVRERLRSGSAGGVLHFDARGLDQWDSVLPSILVRVQSLVREHGLELDLDGLPDGAVRLIKLATAVRDRGGVEPRGRSDFVSTLGTATIAFAATAADMAAFIGESCIAVWRLLRGRALMRGRDFWLAVQQAGVDAVPIITLISVLVGMIQAFVGGSQLALFGAQVFVANLVAIGMLREMGAMMAALIMAGRTGAAYAAELGTMQVNEEIDALRTLGISPMEFLVLPRLLAFTLMMPLLAVYANLAGILGGAAIGIGVLGITPTTYYEQSLQFVRLQDVGVGLVKAAVFGLLVAAAGCLRGIHSGRDAAAVGAATTSAVVSGIVAVIVADCVINVVCYALGF